MFRALFYTSIPCLLLTLSACGGGGGDDAGVNTFSADAAYTGSRDPALLTQNNTLQFVDMLLGSSDLPGGDVSLKNAGTSDADEMPLHGTLRINKALHEAVMRDYQSGPYHQRQINIDESEPCEYGGSLSLSGSVESTTGKGNATYRFNNCQLEQDIGVHGDLSMNIRAFDVSDLQPISYLLTFEGLTINDSDTSAVFTGTSDYVLNSNNGVVTQMLNLHAREAGSGEQRMLKNLKLTSNSEGVISGVTGKLFIAKYGYVDVTSGNDLRLWWVVENGEILLRGAAQSAARVAAYEGGYGYQYRVDLDADGNGTYELRSVQSLDDTATPLSTNRAPVVVLDSHDAQYEDGFRIGDSVYLFASDSYDPDGDAFTYTWSVEEKPAGSSVSFYSYDAATDTQVSTVTTTELDKLGDYKFSLKLTDATGVSAISFMDITLVDAPPEIVDLYVSGSSADSGDSFEAGQSISAYPHVVDDYDDYYESGALELSWKLTRPAGSQAVLENTSNETTAFTPDLVGQYTLKLTVTDSSGGMDVFTRVIEVTHTAPTAEISLFDGNLFTVGEEIQLSGYGYSLSDYELDYLWEVVSAPAGSSTTFVPNAQDNYVAFTPDKVGTYQVSLTVTDDYGAQGTTYKNISVIAAD